MHRETDRLANIKRDRQTDSETDRQTETETDRQTDRQRFSVSAPVRAKLLFPAWQRKSV